MTRPKVSVIVPCYGVEKYLDRCMESIVNQTLRDIEIILVDDKSPDRVPEMCDEWAKKDPRIKVIHKERNEGLGYARNTGLEIATGEYVAFVDSDDYIDKKTYEISYGQIQDGDTDAVFWGINTEYASGKWKKQTVQKLQQWRGKEIKEFLYDIIACAPHVKQERLYEMSVWHSIFKRSIIEEYGIRFLSERDVASEDLPFMVDFLQKSNYIKYIPDCCYYYCLNNNSLTTTFKPERYERFRTLYYLLLSKMNNDEEGKLRIDRFFIGYTRVHILLLVESGRSDKFEQIRLILDDDIWAQLKVCYMPKWLPFYQSLFLNFIYGKRTFLVYILSKLKEIIRK